MLDPREARGEVVFVAPGPLEGVTAPRWRPPLFAPAAASPGLAERLERAEAWGDAAAAWLSMRDLEDDVEIVREVWRRAEACLVRAGRLPAGRFRGLPFGASEKK